MEYNLDKQAFAAGFLDKKAAMQKEAWDPLGNITRHFQSGGGGFRDMAFNSARDSLTNIADGAGKLAKPAINKFMGHASEGATSGAITGAAGGLKDGIQTLTGWDSTKGVMDNVGSMIKNNPMTSGVIGGGLALGAGYLGGKALGLFGGSSQNNQPGTNGIDATKQPVVNNGLQEEAYTQGYAPKALQKAAMPLTLPIGDIGVPKMFNLPMAVGSGMFKAINSMNTQEEPQLPQEPQTPQPLNITAGNDSAKELLKDPKMQAYVQRLVQDTYR